MVSLSVNTGPTRRATAASATLAPPRVSIAKRLATCCALIVACHFAVGESRADATDAGSENKLVTGRLGAGAMVAPRYSGGTSYQTFPVPLASVDIGDFAYIDYWEAGLYLLSNHEKTLGLALVATPRLGFVASDGQRLAGIMARKSSIESGLSIGYGSNNAGVSLGYLHDVTGASNGGLLRLLVFKRIDFTEHFGVDAFVGVERLSAKVADYYYGVADSEATAARSAFQAGASTSLSAGLHFNYDFGRKSTLLFGYEPMLLGNTLADSPIVEHRMANLFYVGYGWRL